MQDMQPDNMNTLPDGQPDREGAMARADLYKLANYSLKLFKRMEDEDQLEGWVQAKITKAADYIASVYHYLEYEMKISEYGSHLETAEMYSEGQKAVIKHKLMEAKEKVAQLKKLQAGKKAKENSKASVKEGIMTGGEESCSECGGSGMVYREATPVPDHVKNKVEKYNRQAKAMNAASKRLDRNKNGIPDDEEMSEDETELKKTGDSKRTATGTLTKTDTGVVHKNTSYSDGSDDEVNPQSGRGKKSHAKAQSAAEKKDRAPKQKQSPKSAKTYGMKDGVKFDNRDKEVDETFGGGVYAEGSLPMVKKDGKMVPAFAADGKGKNDIGAKSNDDKSDAKSPAKKGMSDKQAKFFGKKTSTVKEAHGLSQMMPSPPDGATAAPPKGKDGQYPLITSGPHKGKRWTAEKPGPTNPAFKETAMPMTTVNGKKVPAFAADGKGKGDLAKGKKSKDVNEEPNEGNVVTGAMADKDLPIGAPIKGTNLKKTKQLEADQSNTWKDTARAMKESLNSISTAIPQPESDDMSIGEADGQNELGALVKFASEKDPQGFAAVQNDPDKLLQFLQQFTDQSTGAGMGAPNSMPQSMEQDDSAMMYESVELDRMRTLMQRLNG